MVSCYIYLNTDTIEFAHNFKDDLKNAVKYVKLLLENESTRMGENSHSVGLTLLEILSEISSYVKINSVSIR